ncbi:MAG: lysine--tRNA ligase [Candidatus Bipolaricaulota bacterium]
MTEQDLIASRREKLARIRSRGVEPFPNRFHRTHTMAEVREPHKDLAPGTRTEEEVHVAGRLMSFRKMGKVAFADLGDLTGRVQLYASRDVLGEEGLEAFTTEVDLGDILGAWGVVMTTRKGELSVELTGFQLLAKALRPPPEKWHGLQDVEKRYRQRAQDLMSRAKAREVIMRRALILRAMRAFLQEQGFVEVETPVLQPLPGGATARPFVTHHNTLDKDLYLRVAPELYLKRLLVGGLEKVYELGKSFRNEGVSTEHNPEFTSLEAYQAYADYRDAMDLTEALVERCAVAVHGVTRLQYQGREMDFTRPWRRVPLLEAVATSTGVDVERPLGELVGELERRGVVVPDHLRQGPKGKVLEHLLETRVRQDLWNPTFVVDFPRDISPLAKRKPGQDDLVERFELYIAGREVANAFSELNDPDEQRARFADQDQLRGAGDEEAQRTDEEFLTDLELGMPPAAGVGIGVDRLVMSLVDAASIREVIAFPLVGERR